MCLARAIEIVKDLEGRTRAVHWRTFATKLLARRGAAADAIAVGREAVTLAKGSDSLVWAGEDADGSRGGVLPPRPSASWAAEAAQEALRLYERKQNLPGAEQALALSGRSRYAAFEWWETDPADARVLPETCPQDKARPH